jgi:hypothetical protein
MIIYLNNSACCCASVGNILVMQWKKTPSIGVFGLAQEQSAPFFNRTEPFAIVIIANDVEAPDDGGIVNGFASTQLQEFGPLLQAIAMVNKGTTFTDKLTRISMGVSTLMVKAPQKRFVSCSEAAAWVFGKIPVGLPLWEFTEQLEQLNGLTTNAPSDI